MFELVNGATAPNTARYELLFLSDYFSIHEFLSHASERIQFKSKITSQFCVNLPRTGFFTYKAFRQNLLEHNSRALVEKPGTEFKLTQESVGIGVCTVIHFSDKGFNAIKSYFPCDKISFFNNQDKPCVMFGLAPTADYLHYNLLDYLKVPGRSQLQVDLMVFDLLENIFTHWVELPITHFASDKIKYNHLLTVEKAKEFLFTNMSSDISLSTLARHCCVSPFHLVRLFKRICQYSPFHYLQQIRLKYAQTLLTTTELPITDVCFRSGFTRLDYFSSAFSKQFSVSPSRYKTLKDSNI
jgi:AraC family transcriptional regulator